MLQGENREVKKVGSCWELIVILTPEETLILWKLAKQSAVHVFSCTLRDAPRTPLAWATSALHQATTARQPPTPIILYMYCTGDTECLSHTPGSHSVCAVKTLLGVNQKNLSIMKEPMLKEFWRHTLSGCRVCNWGFQYHLCRWLLGFSLSLLMPHNI